MFISREGLLSKMHLDFKKNSLANKDFSYFTYSREAIAEILKSNNISSEHEILLPQYLCHTVIESILPTTANIKFYNVDDKLSFNKLEIINKITDKTRLIIFVDYFGVQTYVEKDLESILKKENIIIVKDSAHAFLSLVNTNFNKDYEYDYLISSIYKNLPLQVGSIAIGKFKKTYRFINFYLLIKRFIVLMVKNIICFFGQQKYINTGMSILNVSNKNYVSYSYGINAIRLYMMIYNRINFSKILTEKKLLVSEFDNFFRNNCNYKPVFASNIIKQNILQAYPIIFENQTERDLMLNLLRDSSIDAYTWPTFHELNVDISLWSRVLLLPLNINVLKFFRSV